jgi:hypothetical protein
MRKRAGTLPIRFAVTIFVLSLYCFPAEVRLPAFGKDTVLVWNIHNQDFSSKFVVRIAEFLPDRYVEWEDETTQGTIFMPNRAVMGAKRFVSARLFEGGVDTRGKDATTLWLSQKVFRDLKDNKKIKISLDSIDSWLSLEGSDKISVEVNKSLMDIPVIKVKDDRGSERWFLDDETNPLLAKHLVREFTQTLESITTDRPNTLRWIKGKKLTNPH